VGVYNTVKGSLIDEEEDEDAPDVDFSDIEFYGDNVAKVYDVDSSYIDKLLETYSPNNENIRDDIENALQKLEKHEIVKEVYRAILDAIDTGEVDDEEDIFVVKRTFFTDAQNKVVQNFADAWFVDKEELHLSRVQYLVGMDPIPNISAILNSRDFEGYKAVNPGARKLKHGPEMKRQWKKTLDESLVRSEEHTTELQSRFDLV